MQLGKANLGDTCKGDEGKDPSSLEPRVGAAVGAERCTGDASLGDDGDEGKGPSLLGPRVGAAVGVERCTLVMQNLVTRVTKAKSHRHWGRVWERRWVSRDASWE
jgi:hypothetical protein